MMHIPCTKECLGMAFLPQNILVPVHLSIYMPNQVLIQVSSNFVREIVTIKWQTTITLQDFCKGFNLFYNLTFFFLEKL